ncbi:MAG: hypothetical protein AAFP85_11735 [Pseudomonadota bacterium]
MSMNDDGTDPRLATILRIKKARQSLSRQILNRAIDVENQRRKAERLAQDHHEHCTVVATDYVRSRFEAAHDLRDVGRFFQSLAVGNYNARRNASRAQLVVERVSYRRGLATQEREAAASIFLSDRRSADGLQKLLEDQRMAAEIRDEIQSDDEVHETAAGSNHGKA